MPAWLHHGAKGGRAARSQGGGVIPTVPMDRPEWDNCKIVVPYRSLLGSFRAEPPEVRAKQVLQGIDL